MRRDQRLYDRNDPMAKPNMPVRIPQVQRSSLQQQQLNSLKRRDLGESTYITGKSPILSFKNGGKVSKTGIYKLHKGERVLSKKQLEKIAESHLFGK